MFLRWKSKRKRRASGFLLFTLVSIAVSAVVAIGLTKMNEQNFRVAAISNEHMQARHHAQELADIIRVSSFASLSGMPKTVIGGVGFSGEPFYEEVIRKTNPGYLIDGQLVGSNEASDKKALNSEASQDYAKSRFNNATVRILPPLQVAR